MHATRPQAEHFPTAFRQVLLMLAFGVGLVVFLLTCSAFALYGAFWILWAVVRVLE